jgi:hypothetical protein
MPILIWIKSIKIDANLNFTDKSDPLIDCWYDRANIYVFFSLFYIPLIPLRCKQSIRIDKYGNIYERKITYIWGIVNQMFWVLWVMALFFIFWIVATALWY